jgi:hypothetical protein
MNYMKTYFIIISIVFLILINSGLSQISKEKTNNIVVIPHRDGGHILKIINKEIISCGKINIPYNTKSVISENGLIISLSTNKDSSELYFHDMTGRLIKKIKTNKYKAISIKSNTLYLGGIYENRFDNSFGLNKEGEIVSIIDLENNDFTLDNIELPIEVKKGKAIDDILVFEDKMVLVDNILFPKYMFEYNIINPNKPKLTNTYKLPISGTYEHIVKGDINKDWMILLSSTIGREGGGNYVTIWGKVEIILGIFSDMQGNNAKIIEKNNKNDEYKIIKIEKDFGIKDIAIINENLYLLTTKGLLKIDLLKEISFENATEISAKINNADKILKINENIIIYNIDEFELIKSE